MDTNTAPSPLNLRLKRETVGERFMRRQHPHAPDTPSMWFSHRYPEQAERWGCPFLEEVKFDRAADMTITTPLHMNDNFFAAIFCDRRLGHSVVFYEPEQQWYFLEPRDGCYHLTSEAKLMVLLSAMLARCAEEMPLTVNRYPLFVTFRDDERLNAVVKKTRSILAADSSFFSATSPHKRVEGPELHQQTAKRFIAMAVEKKPQGQLTVNDTFEAFIQFCTNNGLTAVQRRQFKQLVAEVIKEEFGLGLRNDVDRLGKSQQGWVGLELRGGLAVTGGFERN